MEELEVQIQELEKQIRELTVISRDKDAEEKQEKNLAGIASIITAVVSAIQAIYSIIKDWIDKKKNKKNDDEEEPEAQPKDYSSDSSYGSIEDYKDICDKFGWSIDDFQKLDDEDINRLNYELMILENHKKAIEQIIVKVHSLEERL